MPILEVRMLGPPNVQWDGDYLTIPRRQVRALLYFLVLEKKPVPRVRLCNLFWPLDPDACSSRKLTHLLTHLNRALPVNNLIIKVDGQIGLNFSMVWADTSEFHAKHAKWERTGSLTALRKVIDLYRGCLLDTFELSDNPEFDFWLRQEQRNWECIYLNALLQLIRQYIIECNYQEAIHYCRRYLQVDETVEEVHRCLIELFTVVEDWPAAYRQLQMSQETLTSGSGTGLLSPAWEDLAEGLIHAPGRIILPTIHELE